MENNVTFIYGNIEEYDIKRAGINVGYEIGLFNDELYNKLINMDKKESNIFVGKYLTEEQFKLLNKSIADYVEKFLFYNEIAKNDVIRIKKDAIVFILRNPIKQTKFGKNIEFRNTISSRFYIRLKNNVEIMKSIFSKYNDTSLDIRGLISKENEYYTLIMSHPLLSYIGTTINDILRSIEYLYIEPKILDSKFKDILKEYSDLREKYLSRSLKKEYYRELNSTFKFKAIINGFEVLYDNVPNINDTIDITYNFKEYIEPLLIIINKFRDIII